MISTKGALIYKGFGLYLLSEISLPELPCVNEEVNKVDVVIEIGDLSKRWSEIDQVSAKKFVINDNEIMFEVPNTAIFAIQGRNKIVVSPMLGVEEDKIRLYVLGTCMGAILIQRKILPLHGSAVAIDGKAYAIVGDSGAGKSTLAAALINDGYQLLSDDVIPVFLDEDYTPWVNPSYPQQKLWQESLKEFGMENSGFRPLFDRETKFAVPVRSGYLGDNLPLAAIYELVIHEEKMVGMEKIEGLRRFHTLYLHTYRNFLVSRLGVMEWHFKESAKILHHINLFQLKRPMGEFTAPDLMTILLSSIKEEALT